MKQFAVAIIGCGNVSRMHFEAYLPHPERIKIVAVCDSIPESIDEVRRVYGIEQGFVALEEMITQAEWEVAIVCTPTPVRKQVVDVLASAGKHVFVEKPFADTYQDARHMVDTCQRATIKLAVNQNFRYHYPFETARELVAQGLAQVKEGQRGHPAGDASIGKVNQKVVPCPGSLWTPTLP